MAPRKIHTRAYPDLDPPEIVENLEIILKKSPRIKSSTLFRSPLRANSVPKNLAALQQSQVDLRNPFRTRSLDDLDQLDSESSLSSPETSEHPGSRETTPSDLHFLHSLGVSHPRSAQQSNTVPSISAHPTSSIQTTPRQPTFPSTPCESTPTTYHGSMVCSLSPSCTIIKSPTGLSVQNTII